MLRLLYVSVENLCMSSRLRRPEKALSGMLAPLTRNGLTIGGAIGTVEAWLAAGLTGDVWETRPRVLGIFE